MFYNAILAIIPALFIAWATGELQKVMHFLALSLPLSLSAHTHTHTTFLSPTPHMLPNKGSASGSGVCSSH